MSMGEFNYRLFDVLGFLTCGRKRKRSQRTEVVAIWILMILIPLYH